MLTILPSRFLAALGVLFLAAVPGILASAARTAAL